VIYNAVTDFIRKSPHIAIYYKDKVITYDELYKNVNKYSNLLLKRLSPGDHIAIQLSDCPEYFYMFWGAVKAGIIPYLYSTMLDDKDYEDLYKRYPVKLIITDNSISQFDIDAIDDTDHTPFETKETDLCFFMFTSGTTGYIKRVSHQHKDIAFTAINYAKKTINLNSYDVTFSAAKLFFAYGFGNSMTFPLYVGGSTILMSEPSTVKNTLDVIEKYNPTVYFGVPTLYAGQIRSLKSNKRTLNSLRVCISAGEPLPGKLLSDWIELTDVPILDGIGSTEALHIFISNRHESFLPNCSGRLVPGYSAKIMNMITKENIPDGEIGDLYIKGGSLYEYEGEWLSTGDMYIKKGSNFYYQGRSNDMLKIGGVWVSPAEIEAKIIEHNDVLEAGVVLGWTEDGLAKPKAYVVLNDFAKDNITTKVSIKRKCINELPANHYPQWIEFVDTLPKTATGKLRRHILRIWEAFSPPDSNLDIQKN
jgi:acyl-coenzyme A synthetase/AMP-(fatty) acid ligase